MNISEPDQPIWTPTPERVAHANLTRFIAAVGADDPSVTDYASLYRWSIDEPRAFWSKVREFCGLVVSREAEAVVEGFDQMPGARWFPGMRLNFAENLLRWGDDRPALIDWNESGRQRQWTYAELRAEVARLAAALGAMGVGPHDRVAGFMPNCSYTVIAMLAAASRGAVWSSCSPDFGVKGVLDRFDQITPKVLFTADGYTFGGKPYSSLERVREIRQSLP